MANQILFLSDLSMFRVVLIAQFSSIWLILLGLLWTARVNNPSTNVQTSSYILERKFFLITYGLYYLCYAVFYLPINLASYSDKTSINPVAPYLRAPFPTQNHIFYPYSISFSIREPITPTNLSL